MAEVTGQPPVENYSVSDPAPAEQVGQKKPVERTGRRPDLGANTRCGIHRHLCAGGCGRLHLVLDVSGFSGRGIGLWPVLGCVSHGLQSLRKWSIQSRHHHRVDAGGAA